MRKRIIIFIIIICVVCFLIFIFKKNDSTDEIVESENAVVIETTYGINEEKQRYYQYDEENNCYIIYDSITNTQIGQVSSWEEAEREINFDSESRGIIDTLNDLEED